MKPVNFSDEAGEEFAEAALYLERARLGYGVRFRNAVHEARDTISRFAAYGAKIPRSNCRQVIVSDFRYSLIYREHSDSMEIIAVAHHKRRPGYWKSRLKPS